jgi:hypothetical protein
VAGEEHKALDAVQYLWPIFSGVAITVIAGVRLWWANHHKLHGRLDQIEHKLNHAVTEEDMHACKDQVIATDAQTNTDILKEVKAIRVDMREDNRLNSAAHDKIVAASTRSHQELMTQIIKLHEKGS